MTVSTDFYHTKATAIATRLLLLGLGLPSGGLRDILVDKHRPAIRHLDSVW